METRQELKRLRQAEVVHRPDAGVDDAENEIGPETLSDDAGPEAAELRRISEIDVAAFVELRALKFIQETSGERGGIFRRERRHVRPDRLKGAVQSPKRRGVDPEMHIGRAPFLPDREVLIDAAGSEMEVARAEESADIGKQAPRRVSARFRGVNPNQTAQARAAPSRPPSLPPDLPPSLPPFFAPFFAK